MKLPSLAAAGSAVILIAALLLGLWVYSQHGIDRHFDQIAAANYKTSRLGLVTDERVLSRPDYLPVYGSCELVYEARNRIDRFFAAKPTGFRVAPSGDRGYGTLLLAQRFAALGEKLRGKRIFIILTPEWFFRTEIPADSYAGNFSQELAIAALESNTLDLDTKCRLARRMAEYPGTLAKNAFLAQLVRAYSNNTPENVALRPVVTGLAAPYEVAQKFLDPIFTWLGYAQANPRNRPYVPPAHLHSIDWDAAAASSREEYDELTGDNPYGFRLAVWKKIQSGRKGYFYRLDDLHLEHRINATKEWEDFGLMLAILHQYGAKPLFVSIPINGKYYRALGTSPDGWNAYYAGIHRLAHQYRFPLVDFRDHGDDPEFCGLADPNPKGWIYINRVADAFYHGTLSRLKGQL